MVAKNVIDSVFALPLADQVELLDLLRDRLRRELPYSMSSDEQRRLLDERLDEFELDPFEGQSWEQVEKQLRAKLGAK